MDKKHFLVNFQKFLKLMELSQRIFFLQFYETCENVIDNLFPQNCSNLTFFLNVGNSNVALSKGI